MIVEHLEQSSKDEEAKKIPSLTAAYYVIQKSSILKSAVSKQLDTAKISSQSSDSVRKWFDELSQIVNEKEIVPSGIFNFDETSLHLGEDSCKLVMKDGGMKFALFLMDNHSSHNSEAVEMVAKKKNIIIKKFPPNLTHLLQPCDNSIFARFKKTYNNSFKAPTDHSSAAFRSAIFDILPEALSAAVAPSNIKHAFRQTGVWPVKAAPVLEGISGTPEKEASLNDDENKEQLFGKFSPKKKKIEDVKKRYGENESIQKMKEINCASILRKEKKKQSREDLLDLKRKEKKEEKMEKRKGNSCRRKSDKMKWKRKCMRIEYDDDAYNKRKISKI
ncbi:uncharacterized protein MONOS_4594 [Monocercomonoides exilis]|uniref:uncharacterized protein n=1 Tax=Monocercomonoides exilis TaxID=2049356 RepID=UPI00355ACCD7|nr:hypothetical protein MONOS_4594 [Monocercomonoides exilis]|eukprot:MONOS_4594.1-p1 / transcript=MONOS_4594.1 / gene=MONOS_4594 / organism=Monocercomonoides_exilis_PA203 / gene_product=unspecified product / transcript_product=unspecified product / location=Mono_scaffold00124:11231-12534(-) / protein_length=331 / sequence_SO=supercontig / SO=protein_coding / is_pseudo=false